MGNLSNLCLLLVFLFLVFVNQVHASKPVGIITSMDGKISIANDQQRIVDFGSDIMFSDKLVLGTDASLTLMYYNGCRQEWYKGKSVIQIGRKQSDVLEGELTKTDIFDCTLPEVVLEDSDSFKKAAYHFRGVPPRQLQGDFSGSDTQLIRFYGANRNDIIKARIWAVQNDDETFHEGEPVVIYITTNRDAWLKLDYYQADSQVVHLVPDIFNEIEMLEAGRLYVVGGNSSKLKLVVNKPFGLERIHALISPVAFTDAFKRQSASEPAGIYSSHITQLLTGSERLPITEYAITIQTAP